MHVTFWGAAREVTGSCHLLTVGEHTVALDCGMFQGKRSESREKNLRLPFAPESLSAVVLSHAHLDHYRGLQALFDSRRRIRVRYVFENRDVSPNVTLALLRAK